MRKTLEELEAIGDRETIQSRIRKVYIQFHCVFIVEGSDKRAKEEAIAFNFTHYLEDVEEGLITTVVLDPEKDELRQ